MDFIYRFNIELMIKLPHIFIIDFYSLLLTNNNTYINREITLIQQLNEKCNTNIKIDFTDEIKNELIIRPDFKLFIEFLKSNYKNAEIYIYINENILKYYPISVDIIIDEFKLDAKKIKLYSMNNFFDIIIDNLKVKYPSLIKNKQKVYDTQLSIFTSSVSIVSELDKTIKYPTYNYSYYYDICEKIINKYKIKPEVFDNKEILKFCQKNDIPVYNKNGSMYQKDLLYQKLLKLFYYKEYQLSEYSKKEDTAFIDYIKLNKIKNK